VAICAALSVRTFIRDLLGLIMLSTPLIAGRRAKGPYNHRL
jgi:hypothetical protein